MTFIIKINCNIFYVKYKKYSKERTKIKNEGVNLIIFLNPKNNLYTEWSKLIGLVLSRNDFEKNLCWTKITSNLVIIAQSMNCYQEIDIKL